MIRHTAFALLLGLVAMAPRPRDRMSSEQIKATRELKEKVRVWQRTLPSRPPALRVEPPVKRTPRTHGADGKVYVGKKDAHTIKTMTFKSITPSTNFEAANLTGPPPTLRMEQKGPMLKEWAELVRQWKFRADSYILEQRAVYGYIHQGWCDLDKAARFQNARTHGN